MIKILVEALVVGFSSLMMGLLLHLLLGHHSKHANSPKMYQEMIDLSLILFLTGVFLHILFELLGLNLWYCKNGNACK